MNVMQKNQTPDSRTSEIFEVSGLAVDTSVDNVDALHYRPEFQTTGKPRKNAISAIAIRLCTEESDIKHSMHAEAGKIIDESTLQQTMRALEAEGKSHTIEYELAKYRLDTRQLLYLAARINDPETPTEQIQGWTDAFTDKSIEIWGKPDEKFAADLLREQMLELSALADSHPHEYRELLSAASALGLPTEVEQSDAPSYRERFKKVADQVGEYMKRKYGAVFDALDLDQFNDREMTAADMADAVERGIAELAKTNPVWSTWQVIRDEEKAQFNVEGSDFTITVGMKRNSATREEFQALFAHEVLRHAMAATNGSLLDYELQKGLPEYLSWEEAVGVLKEYALTGIMPEKIVNRYIDISVALGDLTDNSRQPRRALQRFAMAREKLRNAALPMDKQSTDATIEKDVKTHINRIYRGTLGDDEHVGVMTKDYVYMGGLPEVCQYIEDELAAGKTIDEIMEYIDSGKFNPTKQSNRDYVESKKHNRSKELVPVGHKTRQDI
jgi:hypothetical protein